jgi:lipopolysaccharide/colanic/teichoic acid biosynthesis glycosyltransferase
MHVCSSPSIIINHLFFTVLFPFFAAGFIVISIILLLTGSPSGVFFVQQRMGRFGIPFKIYKFRTLTNTAYINRFAHFLRRTGLDELPQTVNIIRGEMLLFGPRPKLRHEIPDDCMADYQEYVLTRRPGLLSLCMCRSELGQSLHRTREEMKKDVVRILAYERYEQKRWSLKLMWMIFLCCLMKTVTNSVSIRGNRRGGNAKRVLKQLYQ